MALSLIAALVSSYAAGFLGMGGSALLTPTLAAILAWKFPLNDAEAFIFGLMAAHACASGAAFGGLFAHKREAKMSIASTRPFWVWLALGSGVGALGLLKLTDTLQSWTIGGYFLIAAALVLWTGRSAKIDAKIDAMIPHLHHDTPAPVMATVQSEGAELTGAQGEARQPAAAMAAAPEIDLGERDAPVPKNHFFVPVVGLVAGVFSGLIGASGSALGLPWISALGGCSRERACKSMIFGLPVGITCLAVAGFSGFFGLGPTSHLANSVGWLKLDLLAALFPLGFAAGYLGALSSRAVPVGVMRPAVAVFMALVGVGLLQEAEIKAVPGPGDALMAFVAPAQASYLDREHLAQEQKEIVIHAAEHAQENERAKQLALVALSKPLSAKEEAAKRRGKMSSAEARVELRAEAQAKFEKCRQSKTPGCWRVLKEARDAMRDLRDPKDDAKEVVDRAKGR